VFLKDVGEEKKTTFYVFGGKVKVNLHYNFCKEIALRLGSNSHAQESQRISMMSLSGIGPSARPDN